MPGSTSGESGGAESEEIVEITRVGRVEQHQPGEARGVLGERHEGDPAAEGLAHDHARTTEFGAGQDRPQVSRGLDERADAIRVRIASPGAGAVIGAEPRA